MTAKDFVEIHGVTPAQWLANDQLAAQLAGGLAMDDTSRMLREEAQRLVAEGNGGTGTAPATGASTEDLLEKTLASLASSPEGAENIGASEESTATALRG